MDIEGQENEIHANENLNSISTIIALETLVEDDKKRSSVWLEFLVIDGTNFSDGKKRAKCSHCKKATFIAIAQYETSNMKKHLEKCKAYQAAKSSEGGGEKRFEQKVYHDLLGRANLRHVCSFSWVEHEGNREIHTYLNNEVRTITRNTAKADCLKEYTQSTNPPTPVVSSTPSSHTGGSSSRIGNCKRKFDYLAELGLDFSDSLMDLMRDVRFRRLLRLWLLVLAQIWRPRCVAFLLLL
ncbi:hypothetical protein Cgig2_006637 [Carnegiea gigantea]|uniref:BED-type domain-containing protein n=1 Tax=Carnegiea gigantea TaxID=171969 RepID=A0A9Q1JN76_9CARY|nr:hypothetical protein Cgig2_006637 [Carnegiea gigantea]